MYWYPPYSYNYWNRPPVFYSPVIYPVYPVYPRVVYTGPIVLSPYGQGQVQQLGEANGWR
jgi:hypothetical protein